MIYSRLINIYFLFCFVLFKKADEQNDEGAEEAHETADDGKEVKFNKLITPGK